RTQWTLTIQSAVSPRPLPHQLPLQAQAFLPAAAVVNHVLVPVTVVSIVRCMVITHARVLVPMSIHRTSSKPARVDSRAKRRRCGRCGQSNHEKDRRIPVAVHPPHHLPHTCERHDAHQQQRRRVVVGWGVAPALEGTSVSTTHRPRLPLRHVLVPARAPAPMVMVATRRTESTRVQGTIRSLLMIQRLNSTPAVKAMVRAMVTTVMIRIAIPITVTATTTVIAWAAMAAALTAAVTKAVAMTIMVHRPNVPRDAV